MGVCVCARARKRGGEGRSDGARCRACGRKDSRQGLTRAVPTWPHAARVQVASGAIPNLGGDWPGYTTVFQVNEGPPPPAFHRHCHRHTWRMWGASLEATGVSQHGVPACTGATCGRPTSPASDADTCARLAPGAGWLQNGECDAGDSYGTVPGIALQKKCYGCFRIPALARNPLTGVLHAFVEVRCAGSVTALLWTACGPAAAPARASDQCAHATPWPRHHARALLPPCAPPCRAGALGLCRRGGPSTRSSSASVARTSPTPTWRGKGGHPTVDHTVDHTPPPCRWRPRSPGRQTAPLAATRVAFKFGTAWSAR